MRKTQESPFTMTHQLGFDRRNNTYFFMDFTNYTHYYDLSFDEAKALVRDMPTLESRQRVMAHAADTGLAMNIFYHDYLEPLTKRLKEFYEDYHLLGEQEDKLRSKVYHTIECGTPQQIIELYCDLPCPTDEHFENMTNPMKEET